MDYLSMQNCFASIKALTAKWGAVLSSDPGRLILTSPWVSSVMRRSALMESGAREVIVGHVSKFCLLKLQMPRWLDHLQRYPKVVIMNAVLISLLHVT